MQKNRYKIILIIIIIFGVCSCFGIIKINILTRDKYKQLLTSKVDRIIYGTSAPRGRILDRNGNILVDNVGIKTIIYTKISGIEKTEEIKIALKLAELIDLENYENIQHMKDFWMLLNSNKAYDLITSEEYRLLEERKLTNNDIYNLKIERITLEMLSEFTDSTKKAAYIYALMNDGYSYDKKTIKSSAVSEIEYAKVIESNIPGVTGEVSWERIYPYGNVLRNIFGNVSTETAGIPKEKQDEYLSLDYKLNDRVGISYLEEQYEKYLRGNKNEYKINKDNTLTLVKEGKRGNDLVLAIDINLQIEIEKIIEENIIKDKKRANTEYFNSAYAIISDPNTGHILAISGKQIIEGSINTTFKDVTTNIFTTSYTMGSVVKGASMTAAYNNGLVNLGKRIMDGCVKLYNVPEKCSWKRLGYIDEITALKYSSNYYQYLLAIKSTGLTYKRGMIFNISEEQFELYRNTFKQYGLGALTGIDIPNEKLGIEGEKIAGDMLLNYVIGGYDTYTPMQLLQYINTISSGKRHAPALLLKVINESGETVLENSGDVLNKIDIEPENLERIQKGFIEVMKAGGTGSGYVDKKYNSAGKTGTSESYYDSNGDGINDIKTISSNFVMYAPYDNPKYSMAVITPHVSHYNGKTDYTSLVNMHISREISDFLFENY